MSGSGKPAEEGPFADVGRAARAPAARRVDAEEMLAELVRLVESSGLAPAGPQAAAEPESERDRADAGPRNTVETTSARLPLDMRPSRPSEAAAVDAGPITDDFHANGIDLATGRRSASRIIKASALVVSALVLAGAAMLGAVFWLERDGPARSKTPPVLATAHATAPSTGAAPIPLESLTHPAPGAQPPPAVSGPAGTGAAQPIANPSAARSVAAPGDAPNSATPIGSAPPAPPQSPDSRPASTASLPTDQTPAASAATLPTDQTPAASAATPGEPAAPLPPVRPASKAAIEARAPLPPIRPAKAASQAAGFGQSSPKVDLPTRLSNKPAAHGVAKADAAGPGEAQAVPPAAPAPAPLQAPNPNPVVSTFNTVVGAVRGVTSLIPFVNH